MSTLREWLNDENFDWETGEIILQNRKPTEWDEKPYAGGWDECDFADRISQEHEVLDYNFDNGFGRPECPRFIAKDKEAIYFPSQYDGSTCLEKVYLDISKYLAVTNKIYPGG
jgi:hypothetical protein